jgi:hypothetical protein
VIECILSVYLNSYGGMKVKNQRDKQSSPCGVIPNKGKGKGKGKGKVHPITGHESPDGE